MAAKGRHPRRLPCWSTLFEISVTFHLPAARAVLALLHLTSKNTSGPSPDPAGRPREFLRNPGARCGRMPSRFVRRGPFDPAVFGPASGRLWQPIILPNHYSAFVILPQRPGLAVLVGRVSFYATPGVGAELLRTVHHPRASVQVLGCRWRVDGTVCAVLSTKSPVLLVAIALRPGRRSPPHEPARYGNYPNVHAIRSVRALQLDNEPLCPFFH
jgi:hypothetical protein